EVKNESSVKSEWDHHFAPGKDGWGLLADFHNRVASAIHKKSPGVKVGGPASAYMQMQVKDFTLYRSQARFIEETRGQIDFFSHHFYENAGTAGAYARRGDGYSSYLLGRYEAILDMLRAHMEKVDHVLPILVTETGSLQNGREPSENWHRLYAWSAYLNKSMQRPDQLDLFIPFIFLHMPWNPHSGDAAFTPREDVDRPIKLDDFEPSIIASFFELWRDFDGKRLPVSFDQDWLDVTAVHDGRRVSLAVTNMGGQQLALDLSETAKAIGATQARQVRLNYHGGEVSFEPETKVDPAAVPVDVNETTVIRLLLPEDAPLKPDGQLTLRRHYATETAVKSVAEPIQFLISVDSPSKVEEAHLLIGLHRQGGIHEPLEVRVNDTQVEFAIGDAAEFSEYFGTLEAKVPAALLKAENDVTISVQKDATITSVQILTTNSLSPSEN
ncbi:MAG: beta-agarase, partial [Verrucomicrobiota bacterium]